MRVTTTMPSDKFTTEDHVMVSRMAERFHRFNVDQNIKFWSGKGPDEFRQLVKRGVSGKRLPFDLATQLQKFMNQRMQEVRTDFDGYPFVINTSDLSWKVFWRHPHQIARHLAWRPPDANPQELARPQDHDGELELCFSKKILQQRYSGLQGGTQAEGGRGR